MLDSWRNWKLPDLWGSQTVLLGSINVHCSAHSTAFTLIFAFLHSMCCIWSEIYFLFAFLSVAAVFRHCHATICTKNWQFICIFHLLDESVNYRDCKWARMGIDMIAFSIEIVEFRNNEMCTRTNWNCTQVSYCDGLNWNLCEYKFRNYRNYCHEESGSENR